MFHPYGDPSANGTLSWGAEPQYRGTYSILSSCIITIGLCVWTAVHLNVPEHGRVMPQFWRKMKWLAIGLIAPEMVVWTAFQQRREAQLICNMMRTRFAKSPSSSTTRAVLQKVGNFLNCAMFRKHLSIQETTKKEMRDPEDARPIQSPPFTLVHGHYVAMGGFAVDTSGAGDVFMFNFGDRQSLTARGLELLVTNNPELLPNISEEEIHDKSKANGLAKALVCLQAVWFCTQIVVRMASHLTISILELNTFAHALCTLLIFALWWEKPLDITEPTLIQGEAAQPSIALLHVLDLRGFEAKVYCEAYLGSLPCFKCPHTMRVGFYDAREHQRAPPCVHGQRLKDLCNAKVPISLGYVRAVSSDTFHGFGMWFASDHLPNIWSQPPWSSKVVDLPQSIMQYLESARSATRSTETVRQDYYLVERKKNITSFLEGRCEEKETLFWQAMTGITIAGLMYGGLHLTAWNAPMPSVTRLLWRISGVLVTISGAGCLPWVALSYIRNYRQSRNRNSSIDMTYEMCFKRVYLIVVTIVYAAARVFLVVECFVNVRHLPATTFIVPRWSQYFPHIS